MRQTSSNVGAGVANWMGGMVLISEADLACIAVQASRVKNGSVNGMNLLFEFF